MRQIVLLVLVIANAMTSQAQQMSFTKSYFNSGWNWAWSLVQLNDSGYILSGNSSPLVQSHRAFYMRTDKYGDSLWTKRYNIQSEFGNVLMENDSMFIVTSGFSSGIRLSKANLQGDTLWSGHWGYNAPCNGGRAIFDNDSGYIISSTPDCNDYGILKINKQGNEIWHNYADMYACSATIPDKESGYVSVGSKGHVYDCYSVRKLDSYGIEIWQHSYGNSPIQPSDFYYCVDVAIMPDSNYLITTNGQEWQLMKVNKDNGDTLWTRWYGWYYNPQTMIQVDSTRFLFANNYHIVMIDGFGNIIWDRLTPLGSPNQIIKTNDNGFAYCGVGCYGACIVLVKLDSAENVQYTSTFDLDAINNSITISPNPVIDNLTISGLPFRESENVDLKIYDGSGRMVLSQSIQYNSNQINLYVASLKKGLYQVVVQSEWKSVDGRFLKE